MENLLLEVRQAGLDKVHVTIVQSRHCRWQTDSFTFVRVVSPIFAIYQVIYDDAASRSS